MFASKSLMEHLMRGGIGLGAFIMAWKTAGSSPWLALAMLPVALVALRGCPTCWLLGLFQTVLAKLQGRSDRGFCSDGTCAAKRL